MKNTESSRLLGYSIEHAESAEKKETR